MKKKFIKKNCIKKNNLKKNCIQMYLFKQFKKITDCAITHLAQCLPLKFRFPHVASTHWQVKAQRWVKKR